MHHVKPDFPFIELTNAVPQGCEVPYLTLFSNSRLSDPDDTVGEITLFPIAQGSLRFGPVPDTTPSGMYYLLAGRPTPDSGETCCEFDAWVAVRFGQPFGFQGKRPDLDQPIVMECCDPPEET